jgi:hypothetical protein
MKTDDTKEDEEEKGKNSKEGGQGGKFTVNQHDVSELNRARDARAQAKHARGVLIDEEQPKKWTRCVKALTCAAPTQRASPCEAKEMADIYKFNAYCDCVTSLILLYSSGRVFCRVDGSSARQTYSAAAADCKVASVTEQATSPTTKA